MCNEGDNATESSLDTDTSGLRKKCQEGRKPIFHFSRSSTFSTKLKMQETLFGRRTGSDIAIIAFLGVLLCVGRTSVAAPVGKESLSSGVPSGSSSAEEYVCRTKGCLDAAQTYLKNMDQSVDPCDNFYKFACGGFLKSTIVPGDKDSVSTFTLISDGLEEQLRTSIELPIQPNEPKPFRLVKNFYKSCMNEDEIETQGLRSLRKVLNKLGGWPVVSGDRSCHRNFDWKSSIYKVRDAGYNVRYLMNIFIFTDLKTTTKRSIYIDQPTFGLSYEYLAKGFDDKIVQAYYSYMVDIAVILGATRDRAMTELKESLLFELKLANISMPPESRLNNMSLYYNPMTLTALKKNYSTIPWKEYFVKLLPLSDAILEDEVVIVGDPNYIASLEKLMEITPKRVQANYVMWRIVADSVSYLNRDMRARELAYMAVLKGVTERKPRWKECIDAVSGPLSLSVGAMYVRSYFNEDAKVNAVNTIMDIRKQLVKILRQVEWMDDNTRKSALEKLAAMSSNVAYSDEILKVDRLEKYYENLELSGGNYLESTLNCSLFQSDDAFSKLHKPVKKNDWTSGKPAVVNAFYSPMENSIELPAGILQGVFFSNDRPKYTNYGAMGFFVGHEITHGFDNTGRQFDKNGNLADWWAATTRENFVKRAKCMVQQYGNYTVDEIGLKLNGEKIVNENIADNGGIKEAYLAYDDWVARNPPEKQLPGLDYTPKQMFWISSANPWCTKYTPKALRHVVATDVHSPAEFRVVVSLSNMPQFSNDFNCPIGSNMNPINKCSVW